MKPQIGSSRRFSVSSDPYLIAAITVAALYFGQALLIPLALATVLAFALTPGIAFMRRLGASKGIAAAAMMALLLMVIGGVGSLIATQANSLVEQLPTYERTLKEKIAVYRGFRDTAGPMDRAGDTLKKLEQELNEAPATRPTEPSPLAVDQRPERPSAAGEPPVIVEVREPPLTPLGQLLAALKYAVSPLATAGLVLLFLAFILVEREVLRDRLIRLLGDGDVERSTTALNETAARLSKYLSVLLMLNLSFGAVVGIGLWLIGVPGAALWGLVTALMRFVPFIGSFIAAAFPVLIAASVDPGWGMVGMTIALFVIAEPLMGHVIEPIVQGKATGLSMLAILVATAFWTLLWGPIGLLLAVPLSLVLVSFGKHVEPLAVFSFLLGDEPPLTPAEKFYQRVLSGDSEDAVAQAEEQLQSMSLPEYYDSVALKALTQASRDFERDRFDAERLEALNESVVEVVELLSDRDDAAEETPELPERTNEAGVVCIGARTAIDDASAHLLAHLLKDAGETVRIVPPNDWRSLGEDSPRIICVAGFSRHRVAYAARVAARAVPSARVIMCHWSDEQPSTMPATATSLKGMTAASTLAATLAAVAEPNDHRGAKVDAAA
ncbi:MAG: AI-2E family transporter [Hyphomicrobium sp.]